MDKRALKERAYVASLSIYLEMTGKNAEIFRKGEAEDRTLSQR